MGRNRKFLECLRAYLLCEQERKDKEAYEKRRAMRMQELKELSRKHELIIDLNHCVVRNLPADVKEFLDKKKEMPFQM